MPPSDAVDLVDDIGSAALPTQEPPQKRKFDSDDSDSDVISGSSTTLREEVAYQGSKRLRLSGVLVPDLTYPKAFYAGHACQEKAIPEREAVKDLTECLGPDDDKYFVLTNFCIYRPQSSRQPGTLAALNDLLTRKGNTSFNFSGTVRVGARSHYVEGVPFEIVSVEGYDEENVTVRSGIYIQSRHLRGGDIWYKLENPASEYSRYHVAYLWLADFCKHFVSYTLAQDRTTLHHFKSHFFSWVKKSHGQNPIFQAWYAAYGRQDFRTVVAAYYEYLWKEGTSLGGHDGAKIRRQYLWKEVDPEQLTAVPEQICDLDAKTIVTPYVFSLFRHMYFGDQLESIQPCDDDHKDDFVERPDDRTATTMGSPFSRNQGSMAPVRTVSVRVGDVICLDRDADGHWRDTSTTWYAYVHNIERTADGADQLHIFWLYRPSDTTCGIMKYPHERELFFSDHCNCQCNKTERIYSHEITTKLPVRFATTPPTDNSYFIRQTFITEDDMNHFVTFSKSHLTCEHRTHRSSIPVHHQYSVGSTVLVQRRGRSFLDPVSVIAYRDSGKTVQVREFLRKGHDLHIGDALINEIVYTSRFVTIPSKDIKRTCHIRSYNVNDIKRGLVPPPYNLQGVGDHWILTGQLAHDGRIGPCKLPFDFEEGYNPESTSEKLSILDLFCGSGSFGRGVEVGGAAEVKWAVDIDKYAIHTKKANLDNNQDTALFYGSAVDYFARAAAGRFSQLIAMIGVVGMIIAGSPCQGFSMLQDDAGSARSRRNASMVALVIAFIDLYRPKYALLENVFGMMRKFGPNKDEDVFAQIVCALVGMGYQCRYFLVEAFSQGGPQKRTRIFINIAAPGLSPIECPPVTHSAPSNAQARGIGQTLAGVRFGKRTTDATPFQYVSVGEACKDLPAIGDASVNCISFPDHRIPKPWALPKRLLMRCIPRHPYGQGFWKASDQKRIPEPLMGTFEQRIREQKIMHSKIWGRVPPNDLFDTITTAPRPDDAKNSKWVHWDEHRVISILEARRGQSFPDSTVLIGQPPQQWKLVGNAVNFNVAAALGLSLRKAMMKDGALTQKQHLQHPVSANHAIVVVKQVTVKTKEVIRTQDSVVTIKRKEVASIKPVVIASDSTNGTTIKSAAPTTARNAPTSTKNVPQLQQTASNGLSNGSSSKKHPIIRLFPRPGDSDDSDNESEDPLSQEVAPPTTRTPTTPTPINWPKATPLSKTQLAKAVERGNHFAQYRAVEE